MKILQILRNRNKILGQNARNLVYIKGKGTTRARRIADNKVSTKTLLQENNIANPKLLGVINNYKEIETFDFDSLPKSFVMKPVHGHEGYGIEILYNRDDSGYWIRGDKSRVSLESMKNLAEDIVEGKFSINNQPDQVLFEERIKPHPAFKNYTYKGTPDIRIVVYNNIPIQAYVRFPTKESKGKANMALNAVGTGVDIASGITTTSTLGKAHMGKGEKIEYVPGTKLLYQGLQIPFWTKLLELSILVQKAIKLKFVAIDFLIDKDQGPLVVELNARPGLSIQIANRAGLRWRLQKVKGLKVKNTAQGIRLGKDLFGGEIEEKIERISGKDVISNIMPITLYYENKKTQSLALIDTSRRTTVIDSQTAKQLGIIGKELKEGEYIIENIKIKIGSQTIESECRVIPKTILGYKVLIGRKDLSDFIIDIKKTEKQSEIDIKEVLLAKKPKTSLQEIDEVFHDLLHTLSMTSALKPTNLESEKEIFFEKKCKYNPQFTYKTLKFNPDYLLNQLNQLNPPDTKIGKLYLDKINEFKRVIYLMESIGTDPLKLTNRSISLYGYPSKKTIKVAKKILSKVNIEEINDSKRLSLDEVIERIKLRLKKLNIETQIKVGNQDSNKISISKISGKINISSNCIKSERNIERMLAHEIDTHLVRLKNGESQEYKIFSVGTADYIKSEEGLAILMGQTKKSDKVLKTQSVLTVLIDIALKGDFIQVYNFATKYYPDPDVCWNFAVRIKRGIEDTSQRGAFTKDQYLAWAIQTAKYILDKPESMKYIFNGKASPQELMEFTKPSETVPPITLEQIQEILDANQLSLN